MFRILLICFFIVHFNMMSTAASMGDINQIRKEFNLALNDEKKAVVLFNQLTKMKPATNTLQYAYLGATEAVLAKHAFNPFSKLTYVNSALIKLNKAVELNLNSIEIRYMRFSIESNMPSYLGYSKHAEEDKNILVKGLSTTKITKEQCGMYKVFANGIINSKYCNKQEENLLHNVITACNDLQLN